MVNIVADAWVYNYNVLHRPTEVQDKFNYIHVLQVYKKRIRYRMDKIKITRDIELVLELRESFSFVISRHLIPFPALLKLNCSYAKVYLLPS